MAGATIHFDGHELEIIRESVDVTSMFAMKPDQEWEETDAAGHRHYRSETETGGPYPTLQWRPDMIHCSDCHEEEDHGYLVCRECGERVQPGFVPDPGPHVIPGLVSYWIDGEPVSKQAAEDFLAAVKRERNNQ